MLFVMTTINFFIVFPAGWLADRFGRKPVMVPGILLAGIGLLLFALAGNVTMMFIAAIIMGIGTGVAGPPGLDRRVAQGTGHIDHALNRATERPKSACPRRNDANSGLRTSDFGLRTP